MPVFELGPGIMDRVADTVSPQPSARSSSRWTSALEELLAPLGAGGGDAGSCSSASTCATRATSVRCLRIAGATGVAGVVCCAGTVDPFNPKVVRASAGAVFRVPVVVGASPQRLLGACSVSAFKCWATVALGGTDYLAADLERPLALVLGNEGAGLAARGRERSWTVRSPFPWRQGPSR